ncbi:MAG: hypothetical protein H6871_01405 [Methylobacteriaceae bacterium]|nr:hypothetical protein [Methylobacteriaceae bacterium]
MNLKTFAAALAATDHRRSSAFAADLPARKAAPATFLPRRSRTWAGFYVGVNVGYGWSAGFDEINDVPAKRDFARRPTRTPSRASTRHRRRASMAAARTALHRRRQIGWNWQSGALVAGVETEHPVDERRQDGRRGRWRATCPSPSPAGAIVPNSIARRVGGWLGTLRARLGFTVTPRPARLRHLGRSGIGWRRELRRRGQASGRVLPALRPSSSTGASSGTRRVGCSVGARRRMDVRPNWTPEGRRIPVARPRQRDARAQALRAIRCRRCPMPAADDPLVLAKGPWPRSRAGLNYHFGWSPPPVVAKY